MEEVRTVTGIWCLCLERGGGESEPRTGIRDGLASRVYPPMVSHPGIHPKSS